MAKDPAFLFYYDRFIMGTYTMTDEQVGKYIRLMCIQANKGYVTEKDMLHICKSYDEEVFSKFTDKGNGKFENNTLSEVVSQRKAYTESRRNNRKGVKNEHINNISESYVEHMVNVDVNVDVNKNLDDFGKSENLFNSPHIVPQLCSLWYQNFPTYTKDQQKDFKAVGSILEFMRRQHGIADITRPEVSLLLSNTMQLIADEVAKEPFWINKPLHSIAKNIQEFYNKIKNPTHGNNKTGAVNLRDQVQAEFDKRFAETG